MSSKVVVPRWLQAVALEAVLFGLSALGRASRPVLLLFVVAGVIALILDPLVEVLQRVGLPRGVAIGVVLPLKARSYATGGSSPRPRCHRGGTASPAAGTPGSRRGWWLGRSATRPTG